METILQFNEILLVDLKERAENWGPRACLGDLFLKIVILHFLLHWMLSHSGFFGCAIKLYQVGFLKVYTEYLRHYNLAAERLHKLAAKRKAFNMFLEDTKANVPDARDLSLESYLIMPVQRIPRYRMLLGVILSTKLFAYSFRIWSSIPGRSILTGKHWMKQTWKWKRSPHFSTRRNETSPWNVNP